jgi:putative transposase
LSFREHIEDSMKKSSFKEQNIALSLPQADSRTPVDEIFRHLGISQATLYKRVTKYGGSVASEVRKLREFEDGNA